MGFLLPLQHHLGGGGVIPKIIEMKEEPKIVSYSRDKKGKIENYHTKEVANTIHCSTGTRGAGSIGKCKFSEKFEELLFWR